MIAAVRFESIMKKETFDKLKDTVGLKATEERVGIRYSKLMTMDTSYAFEDEVTSIEGTSKYNVIATDKVIESYYVCEHPTEEYIAVDNDQEVIIDIDEVAKLDRTVKYSVENIISFNSVVADEIANKINLRQNVEQSFNAKCNVMVPGFELLSIKTVVVRENCCTEIINDMLANNWKIVAVCPQADQRRPDYVMGRTELY